MIIDKLKKNVCRIEHGDEQGTGFLISPNLILTAYHVVEDNKVEEIKIFFSSREQPLCGKIHTIIDENWKSIDIAIIRLNENLDFFEEIKILDIPLIVGVNWISRGYPQIKKGTAENFAFNRYNHINDQHEQLHENNDIDLNFNAKLATYSGYSGAPLIVDDCIVGMIRSELSQFGIARELYGISTKYFKDLLEKVGISISSSHEEHFKSISNSLDDSKKKEMSISRIFLIFTEDNITNNKYKVTGYIYDNDEIESDFIEFTFENIHNEEEQKEFIKILHKESELDNVPIHFIIPPELFLINFKQWKYNGTELIKIYHVLFHNKERFSRKLKRYNQMIKEWDDKFDNLQHSYIYESLLSIPNNEVPYDSRYNIGAYFTYQPDKFEEINRIVNLANIGIWKYKSVDLTSYPQCLEGEIILCDLNKESRKWEHVALLWDDMSLLKELRGEIK